MLLKLKGELGFKRMQTPFECVVPCEKIILPPHSADHTFSSSGVD